MSGDAPRFEQALSISNSTEDNFETLVENGSKEDELERPGGAGGHARGYFSEANAAPAATRNVRQEPGPRHSQRPSASERSTYAADAMTLEELRSRLETLEETRESARREFSELARWHERLQALVRDKEPLLKSYTTRAPEALDSLGPEERRTVYSMLGLRVDALPDKSLRVRGAFGEENLVCHPDRTSTR